VGGLDLAQALVLKEATELFEAEVGLELEAGQGLDEKVELRYVVLVFLALVQVCADFFHGVPGALEELLSVGVGLGLGEDVLEE